MISILWFIVLLGCLTGASEFALVLTTPGVSAPQQAAGAAMAICWAVLPYCFARACAGAAEDRYRKKVLELLKAKTAANLRDA